MYSMVQMNMVLDLQLCFVCVRIQLNCFYFRYLIWIDFHIFIINQDIDVSFNVVVMVILFFKSYVSVIQCYIYNKL